MVTKKDPQAFEFFASGKEEFRQEHRDEVLVLESVHDISRVADPEVGRFLREKFWVRMSRQAFNLLKFQVDFN